MSLSDLMVKKHNSQLASIVNKQWNDFLHQSGISPWASGFINSGTISKTAGTSKHPGVIQYASSTSANSGARHIINDNSILLAGGEKTTFIFKTAATLTGITRRMGFHDSIDQNDAADGVYGEIIDGVIKGKTANNGTRSNTGTTYTLASDTWYRLKIELNSDATLATYALYADDSITVLWTETLNANIPKTAGRETGHGDVCSYVTASSITIGYLDYMDIILPNTRRVA